MTGGFRNSAAPNTPEGRKKLRILGAIIAVAAVLAIVASLVGDHRTSIKLFGVAAGVMFVGAVYIFSSRKTA